MEENKLFVVSFIILLFVTVVLVTFKLILKNKVSTSPQPTPTASTQPFPVPKIECKDPRPKICTMECIQNPPYICGSDGKSYCSVCQACSNKNVTWYEMKASNCEEGQFCGGFSGISCPEGYECQPEGSYPDASGKCIKK